MNLQKIFVYLIMMMIKFPNFNNEFFFVKFIVYNKGLDKFEDMSSEGKYIIIKM